ncbi:hypothetical protein [Sulfurimonas sp.]
MNHEEYILQMASDIETLAGLLSTYKIETTGMYSISGNLKKNKSLKYKLSPLRIEIDNNEKFPKKLSHQKSAVDLVLFFDINLEGNYEGLLGDNDPFNAFSFNIVIRGKNKNNLTSKLLYSIHLDRHNLKEEEEGNKPGQAHPLYHFQFGGNNLKEGERDHGQALFLDSPRIMHHPMEFILGIDFILSNFFPTIWNKINKTIKYKKIVMKYQKDFIQPYFKSIANSFDSNVPQLWNAQKIYPQLVER